MKNLIKTICSISVFAFILASCGDGGKKGSNQLQIKIIVSNLIDKVPRVEYKL